MCILFMMRIKMKVLCVYFVCDEVEDEEEGTMCVFCL